MEFFYQSGAMGYGGEGWKWHKKYKFPSFPIITKTITYEPKKGNIYHVIPFFKSVYNKCGLPNMGIREWYKHYYKEDLILSISCDNGNWIKLYDHLLYQMRQDKVLDGIELNISCPNIGHGDESYVNTLIKMIGSSFKKQGFIKKLYLKVNHLHNLNDYNLNYVDMINLNSVPMFGGGVSGKLAQKDNWNFIKKWQGQPNIPNISGCSWTNINDIHYLKSIGCKNIGIGSVMITNPKFVCKL